MLPGCVCQRKHRLYISRAVERLEINPYSLSFPFQRPRFVRLADEKSGYTLHISRILCGILVGKDPVNVYCIGLSVVEFHLRAARRVGEERKCCGEN